MLVDNKYLKELGWKNGDFPFDRTEKDDPRYGLDKSTGTVEAQTWNLETTIILEMYTYLRDFQDHYMKYGTPAPYFTYEDGDKRWHEVIAEIVEGLKAYIEVRDLHLSDFKDYNAYLDAQKEYMDKFEKSWKLLGENMCALWW